MSRPVTLFTGQWADLPLAELAEKAAGWGFDGLELACWGDHFEVDRALAEDGYIEAKRDLLESLGLRCHAISTHLVGQCVCDPIDERHRAIVPESVWGDGDPEGVRQRAAEEVVRTAEAAARFGVDVVNGFTGSSVWHKLYFFPPTSQAEIEAGFGDFADRWGPIMDAFTDHGVRFALEVHPTEIAYDIHTARRALDAIGNHPAFGFNFDPSHLGASVCRAHDVPRRVPRPDLPRACEGRPGAAGRAVEHPRFAPRLRRSPTWLGFRVARAR